MNIKKSTWIAVGIFLWGLPSAVFMSLFLSIRKPNTVFEIQAMQDELFLGYLLKLSPIFIIGGVLIGLYYHSLASKQV